MAFYALIFLGVLYLFGAELVSEKENVSFWESFQIFVIQLPGYFMILIPFIYGKV